MSHPSSTTPGRQSFVVGESSTLLLIPYIGVKLLTHFPSTHPLAFHPRLLRPLLLPLWLPARLPQRHPPHPPPHLSRVRPRLILHSRPSSSMHVIVGAGALSPYLIRAHISSRPGISKTIVWNRTPGKALSLVENLRACREFDGMVWFDVAEPLEEAVREGDIVSCATSSEEPLVKGEWLEGAHLDLVGSYTRQMRECDDEAIVRARGKLYVDCEEAAEITGTMERGVMRREDVEGMLTALETGEGWEKGA